MSNPKEVFESYDCSNLKDVIFNRLKSLNDVDVNNLKPTDDESYEITLTILNKFYNYSIKYMDLLCISKVEIIVMIENIRSKHLNN